MDLREFLDDSGMTQATLSRRSKVTQSTIFKMLNGADIKLSTAMKICIASKHKITLEDLYKASLNANKKINTDKKHYENKPKC
jgi:predicted transcriptional regulator